MFFNFFVIAGSCYVEGSDDGIVPTVTDIEYIRQTTLAKLLTNWQLLASIAAGIVVFLIIFAIFYKCDLFNRVRVNKDELDQLMAGQGDEGDKVVEVDGENVQMR